MKGTVTRVGLNVVWAKMNHFMEAAMKETDFGGQFGLLGNVYVMACIGVELAEAREDTVAWTYFTEAYEALRSSYDSTGAFSRVKLEEAWAIIDNDDTYLWFECNT